MKTAVNCPDSADNRRRLAFFTGPPPSDAPSAEGALATPSNSAKPQSGTAKGKRLSRPLFPATFFSSATPVLPPSGPVAGPFNSLHPKRKFQAASTMKTLEIFMMLALFEGLANAATITVSQGIGSAQGYVVNVDGAAPATFYWAAGNYDNATKTWTQFGLSVLDTSKVNGSVIAVEPASLTGKNIHIFVGTGQSIGSSGDTWVILQSTNADTLFPPDVSVVGSVLFRASFTNAVTFVAKGNPLSGFTAPVGASGGTLNLVTIPEPSAALLGALGALGLLRRRRD